MLLPYINVVMGFDAMRNGPQQYSQMTTFKDKFEMTWIFLVPYLIININHDEIDKTIIEAYTKSIAHAPAESKELSLAYANRLAVLFRARLYEDCLFDIERLLKAGHPNKLKTKLFLRQSLCFKALKPNSELEPSISMANAIQWLPFLKKYNSTSPKIIKR
ncbi:hypothetical protein HCN44_004596 [Aphidius gifuensis]|uniref:Uncharacterized protein n=1 Tax=Aphidius gifuensis TaxID=684658 RepID=A0A834Y116_APHGI|nr:hypothetical protein HCN44_004596 [Aphidius gifuensis]